MKSASLGSEIPPPGLVLKLKRARSKLQQLRREFNRFVRENPGKWRRVLSEDGTAYLYSLDPPQGPANVQFLADEAVHHLRTLLDHTLTATVESTGKSASGCQFPIRDSEPKTDEEWTDFKKGFKKAPDEIRDLIINVQPFQRGSIDDAHGHPLWMLNRLDNRFKHTTLDMLGFTVSAPQLPGSRGRLSKGRLAAKGDVFAEVPTSNDVERDFEPHIRVEVTFQLKRVGVPGIGLDELFNIYNYVRDDLIAKVISGPLPPRLQ